MSDTLQWVLLSASSVFLILGGLAWWFVFADLSAAYCRYRDVQLDIERRRNGAKSLTSRKTGCTPGDR